MSPEKPTPQHDDEATKLDSLTKAALELANQPNAPAWVKSLLESRNRAVQAAQRLDEAEQQAKDSEPTIEDRLRGGIAGSCPPLNMPKMPNKAEQGISYASENAEAELAAALDVIGRRTDIVAVKLPEPTAPDFTGVEWSDKAAGWDVFAYGSTEHRGKVQVRIPEFVAPADARNAAAALYAAAARADAAEGGAK